MTTSFSARVPGHMKSTRPTHGPATILLADDDADLRALIARRLTKIGYLVSEVGDGEELLAALAETTPDLILSDLQMPLISGIEALTSLRGKDWSIPFILMTGVAGPTEHSQASRLGAAYVLHKPLDLDYLCTLVRNVVAVEG